jgi:DNA-binding NtrC family response regulator
MHERTDTLAGARVLIVDDVPANLDVLFEALEAASCKVLVATDGATAIEVAGREKPDVVLLDVLMPGLDGFATCRRLRSAPATRGIPVIFLTALDDTEEIVKGFRAGALDYIAKPFRKDEVLARIRTHVELRAGQRRLEQLNVRLEEEIARSRKLDSRLGVLARGEEARWNVAGFIGESPTMSAILGELARLRNADSVSVLISGESGTGKELVARAIHAGSARSGGPFVAVNCAAIPLELGESLLFGHLKGAFTGAEREQTGYFELADGGTLFLDEIGAMPAVLQPKLLRVLEDGLIRPLGAREDRRVSVRVVAATNAPMQSLREDLYFRLARFTVALPPLRERREDIPLLARHFAHLFAAEMGIDCPVLSEAALGELLRYPFPGNVRELKNAIERSLIESGGAALEPQHLRLRAPSEAASPPAGQPRPPTSTEDMPARLADAELVLIQRAVERAGGNLSRAARQLGIDRNRIYRRLRAKPRGGSHS